VCFTRVGAHTIRTRKPRLGKNNRHPGNAPGGRAASPTIASGKDHGATGPTFTYNAAGPLDGGQVHTVINTLTGGSATLTYTYDEWGRKVGSNIDGSNSQTMIFDALGRVTNVLNLLAPMSPGFAYSYFDPTHPTGRIGGVTYPNGQSTAYSYLGYAGDERLSEIKNLTPASAVLSQNDYTYDAVGNILTWQQQTDSSTPLLSAESYDAANQLASSVQTNTSTGAVTTNLAYQYDAAGNGMQKTGVPAPSYNSVNQLTGYYPSQQFTGNVNKPVTLTVAGTPVTQDSTGNFVANPPLTTGTNTVAVVARDASGNARTNHYQVVVGTALSPTYDADGNELSNGNGEAYKWDAKNELASIVYSSGSNSGNHTEFTYDTLGRRIKIVERTGATIGSGTITSTKQLVWDGNTLAEERNASNAVTKRFYTQGEQISGASYYYTRDHLGSVREMTNSSGAIQARYSYDPYGKVTKVSGAMDSDFQYAGYYGHAPSGLNLTMYRAYDSSTGRWLSRDPLPDAELIQGANLYWYVFNNAVNAVDPSGLVTTANCTIDSHVSCDVCIFECICPPGTY
jgi:RHS repeat-associated protein